MQTLIDQGATEEESLERIQKLKQILDIMESKHKLYQPNPTATKTDVTEEKNKTKEEVDKTKNRLCDDKTEQENKQNVNTEKKDMTPKDSTPDKDLNLQSGTKTPDTIPQQPEQPLLSNMQKDTKKVDTDLLNKASQSVDGSNEPNPKRVSFNLESNMVLQFTEGSKSSEDAKTSEITDIQIPGVDIANFSFMDLGADTALGDLVIDANVDVNKDDDLNFLDTGNGSDDMDIVGDQDFEIPCSQMICKDPYIKSNDGEAATPCIGTDYGRSQEMCR